MPLTPSSAPRPSSPHPSPPSPSGSPFRLPHPLGTDAPATSEVPPFAPVRVRGGRYGLQRLVRRRRGPLVAGLAVAAVALVAAGPRAAPQPARDDRARGHPVQQPVGRPAADVVTAPVRIADAATVRLLRPGDRVDVIAAEDPAAGGVARVLARGVRVTKVPEPLEGAAESGALVVLAVPRASAARVVGASATARLAVTLC